MGKNLIYILWNLLKNCFVPINLIVLERFVIRNLVVRATQWRRVF
jgi:hypothetical protein